MKKNALIFGDSYSTFKGYVPDGYAVYYPENDKFETDVKRVEQTWWHQVIRENNLNLVLNNSWSGSTIGYTGYNNTDCSKSSSFIYRLRQLIKDGFFEKNQIDTVFVFGGTNDSWSNAPLGEAKQANLEEKDLFFVLPAICYFFDLLREQLPNAEIYCMINRDIKAEIVSTIKGACEKHGMTPITFEKIEKVTGHPTVLGMISIKESVLSALNKN